MERYSVITKEQAIARFGKAALAREVCDGTFVLGLDRPLAFVELGDWARFPQRDHLSWRDQRLHEESGEGCPPAEVCGKRVVLFVRAAADENWTLIDEAAFVGMYGFDGSHCTAGFSLSSVLPSDLVQRLGGHAPPDAPLMGQRLLDAILSPPPGRWSLLRQFYGSWFEALDEPRPAIREPPLKPSAVREWHALWDAISESHRCGLACQPKAWSRRGSVYVIQSEEQDVVTWAIRAHDLELDDPPVLMSSEGGSFEPLAPSVSQFAFELTLLLTAYFGGSGVNGWTNVDRDCLDRIASIARPVPFSPWTWPAKPTRIWTTEEALIVTCDDELRLQTRDEDALARVAASLRLEVAHLEISYF